MTAIEFLSPEWVELYKTIVRDGTADEDLSGIEFGVYELFRNVPMPLQRGRGPNICYGFRVSGGRLEFRDRPWDDATIKIVADFESVAPWVSLPLEQSGAIGVNERLEKAGKLRISGKLTDRPKFMEKLKLHDRLAEITAPYVSSPNWED